MLWPSPDRPLISDPLASFFWSMLDFQEQKCTYVIQARDEQKHLCLGPCFPVLMPGSLDLGAGHTVMKNAVVVW